MKKRHASLQPEFDQHWPDQPQHQHNHKRMWLVSRASAGTGWMTWAKSAVQSKRWWLALTDQVSAETDSRARRSAHETRSNKQAQKISRVSKHTINVTSLLGITFCAKGCSTCIHSTRRVASRWDLASIEQLRPPQGQRWTEVTLWTFWFFV